MLSPTYEITTALSHTDELISPPYDIAIVTISYGRVIMSSVWDSMMSKKNVGWPFYAAVVLRLGISDHRQFDCVRYLTCKVRQSLKWFHHEGDGNNRYRPRINMMTSSNRRIFYFTDPLWRETTGHQWIPLTKASDAELIVFFDLHRNKRYVSIVNTLVLCKTINATITGAEIALWVA